MGNNGTKSEIIKVDGKLMRRNIRRRIRNYERRYEVSSAEMLKMLQSADMHETAEILKWMQSYHVLRFIEQATPTTGTRTTTTNLEQGGRQIPER